MWMEMVNTHEYLIGDDPPRWGENRDTTLHGGVKTVVWTMIYTLEPLT